MFLFCACKFLLIKCKEFEDFEKTSSTVLYVISIVCGSKEITTSPLLYALLSYSLALSAAISPVPNALSKMAIVSKPPIAVLITLVTLFNVKKYALRLIKPHYNPFVYYIPEIFVVHWLFS